MFATLYQYFILNKRLDMPGIGTFLLERTPADFDFTNKCINAPFYRVVLQHGNTAPSAKMTGWLAAVLHTSEADAIDRLQEFAHTLKQGILGGDKLQWNGLGTFTKGLAGEIRFEAAVKEQPAGDKVPAIKVIRKQAEHLVRVGEDEKTSTEMLDILHPVEQKRSYWWPAALVLLILLFLYAGIYFSTHGVSPGAAANQQKFTPAPVDATHQLLP